MARAIDDAAARAAAEAVAGRDGLRRAAARFALLAEPGRLAVLVALRAAGPIPVSDLALACGVSPTAVSQTLRLLRASGAVTAVKEGRVVRYALADEALGHLLDEVPRAGA
ncbi:MULTISPECIES: metalloregulator ArsR/SmtB family transcription factor [unclassified Streptomyces]|uniref:ArsR/SmtB family transcription factor n=1 Tax=Streptomycetaceae TaxID=2062 RepID=UPI002E7AA6A0|nr:MULTISPECIES: metalloregulator ArsR/SmtB family transcription factor [unclassified Streptomyces]MED7952882.1 metalloregulator ArsR/SmtB family transcription factor [Streptomyces sp. BE303]MEE1825164.1 metalloregulator ArsR/SmtB family transcription factor [Streptomyces sp. BE20]